MPNRSTNNRHQVTLSAIACFQNYSSRHLLSSDWHQPEMPRYEWKERQERARRDKPEGREFVTDGGFGVLLYYNSSRCPVEPSYAVPLHLTKGRKPCNQFQPLHSMLPSPSICPVTLESWKERAVPLEKNIPKQYFHLVHPADLIIEDVVNFSREALRKVEWNPGIMRPR